MVVKILASLVFALLPIMAALRADVNVIDLMSVLYVGIGTLCFVAASPHNRWQAMGIGGLLSGLGGCLLGMAVTLQTYAPSEMMLPLNIAVLPLLYGAVIFGFAKMLADYKTG